MLIILVLKRDYIGRDVYGMRNDWSFKREATQANYGTCRFWGNSKG